MNKSILLLMSLLLSVSPCPAELVKLTSKDTLTAVEINSGDVVEYSLQSGRTVRIELLESESKVVFTTLKELKKNGARKERSIYMMTCRIRIDGQEMELVRYVPVQETFYEPYTVNGLNIWFDGLRSLSDHFTENHGRCLPTKEARFALQDADRPICPEEIGNWYPIPEKRLVIGKAYSGEDAWMGPYFGTDLHGGLDMATPSNTTLFAPISFDDQFYFNKVSAGKGNNRWRGIRTWANGDVWQLQTHHLVEPLVPENTPLKLGTAYAYAGGVSAGYISHVHFVFRLIQPDRDPILLDPWILFWQTFRNNNERERGIKAAMATLAPAQTGDRVQFSSADSRHGLWGGHLEYHWDFGDGSISTQVNPSHVFIEPGVYPVTLTVTDRAETASVIQHLTVNGPDRMASALRVVSDDPHGFRKSKTWKAHAYGDPVPSFNAVAFHRYQWERSEIQPKEVAIKLGSDLLKNRRPVRVDISYVHGKDWLQVSSNETQDGFLLSLQPQAKALLVHMGFNEANLVVHHEDALNSPLEIKVLVDITRPDPATDVIVRNSDPTSSKSGFFWLAPKFADPDWVHGHSDAILFNATNDGGEFVRFRPNLAEGTYRVELFGPPYGQEILMNKTGGFNVRVKHGDAIDTVWVEPARSTVIGEFHFKQGSENYVEIISDGSSGLIVVDAIQFQKVN